MPDEGSHPLLQQTALAVNPYIDLPKPPTLPPNYTSLPFSTLPLSILHTAPAATSSNPNADPQLPAYVTSASGAFAAHPSTIIAQNRALLEQIKREQEDGKRKIEEWEEEIRQKELQEKRRKAPGWLDRDERILEPERKTEVVANGPEKSLMDGDDDMPPTAVKLTGKDGKDVEDLGEAMDRAFGRSEMG